MGLKKRAGRVSDFNERLERGKANKVTPAEVRKVLARLHENAGHIRQDLESTDDPVRKSDLRRRSDIARQEIARAEWLLRQL